MNRVTYAGDIWVCIKILPRFIADSWRRDLESVGVPSVVRTPFGWVANSNVIEVEAGSYHGDVELYVPEVRLEVALETLGLEPESQ
jgi:hypothetical protein